MMYFLAGKISPYEVLIGYLTTFFGSRSVFEQRGQLGGRNLQGAQDGGIRLSTSCPTSSPPFGTVLVARDGIYPLSFRHTFTFFSYDTAPQSFPLGDTCVVLPSTP
jgi:hypothetical protein